ncbi:MAG: DnaA/Hda family protein, partial [Planctomycetota bacterium]
MTRDGQKTAPLDAPAGGTGLVDPGRPAPAIADARASETDRQSSPARVTTIALRGRRLTRPAAHRRVESVDGPPCVLPAFVAGPENALVGRVINSLVEAAGSLRSNAAGESLATAGQTSSGRPAAGVGSHTGPITLVGPSGSGKTHLAHGLAELWHKRGKSEGPAAGQPASPVGTASPVGAAQQPRGVAYLTASDFSRQLADAIEDGAVNDFRRQLRGCGLLVIDDLDRVSAAPHVQEELLHTIDSVTASRGLIVFATATLPVDTASLTRPLISRLSGGVVLEIAPLGVEARGELLRQVTETLGCRVSDDALAALAARLPGEPPRLLSAGVELRRRFGATIDAADAARFLDDESQGESPPLKEILAAAARYYGVTQKMLTSASRRQTVVLARAVAV